MTRASRAETDMRKRVPRGGKIAIRGATAESNDETVADRFEHLKLADFLAFAATEGLSEAEAQKLWDNPDEI